jgi:hypothetical protein
LIQQCLEGSRLEWLLIGRASRLWEWSLERLGDHQGGKPSKLFFPASFRENNYLLAEGTACGWEVGTKGATLYARTY